jgi:hypothetical protein
MTRSTVLALLALLVLPGRVWAQDRAHEAVLRAVEEASAYLAQPAVLSFAPDEPVDWTPLVFEDARRYLFRVRTVLLRELGTTDDLEALRSYVDLNFPDLSASDALQFSWAPDGGVIEQEQFESVVARAWNFLARLRTLSPLALHLTVRTDPDGARVAVRPLLGSRTREMLSNGEFPNLYRGLYEYRVSKQGFDTVVGELDLVDDPREVLVCTMTSVGQDSPGLCARTTREAAR